jgi:hypothetical protein
MDLCAVSRWCEGYRNIGKAQSSSVLDRISEWITPTSQTLSRPEIIRGSTIENGKLPYISITYGGESGIRTHGTARVVDNPLTSKAGMADRTNFTPETISPERNERDQSPTKIQQNQRSRP